MDTKARKFIAANIYHVKKNAKYSSGESLLVYSK